MLENDVLRDGGPDSPSVAATLLLVGENDRGYITPFRSSEGISADNLRYIPDSSLTYKACYTPPSMVSVSALYLTYGVLGSVIFIVLSRCCSVR